MIRISSLPYITVILASALPWLAAYFDSKFVALAPDLLMLGVFGVLVVNGRIGISMRPLAAAILALTAIHSLLGLADGRGIGSGGLVLLILEIMVFYKFLERGNAASMARSASQWVSRIYQFHLVFLMFELLGRLAGFTDLFVAIAGHSTVTTIYKTYNSAALLNYFGMSGLNSLLLGSQSASQSVLFAGLWFLYLLVAAPPTWREPSTRSWFAVTCIMYPLNATMTSNLLLLLLLLCMLLAFRPRRINSAKVIRIGLLLIMPTLLIADVAYELLFFRIGNTEDFLIYKQAFDVPIEAFSSIGVYRQMWGWGAFFDESIIADTNSGLFCIMFQVGLLMSFACVVSALAGVRLMAKIRRKMMLMGLEKRGCASLSLMNGVLALGWLISLVHYTPAIELGGRQIFAFHIALAVLFARKFLAESSLGTNVFRQHTRRHEPLSV